MYPNGPNVIFGKRSIPCKAYNSRVLTSWLAEEMIAAAQVHGSHRLQLAAQAAWALHAWYCRLEACGRYLSEAEPG